MSLYSAWKVNKEEVVAENGIVTSALPLSAEAGLSILKAGGNAIDAAVAIGFCNIVQEPYMASIGGMGYMLIHLAEKARTIGVDFNGRAPQGTTDEMYDVIGPSTGAGYKTFDVVDDANNSGPLSATVPATCAGFCEAHKRFGTLPFEQVLEPAIALAEELISIVPGNIPRKVWFGHSGSDANDMVVRLLEAATGRKRFISFYGAYHGGVSGSIAVSHHSSQSHSPKKDGNKVKSPSL